MFAKIKDPVSSLTHLAFAILAVPCTAVFLCFAVRNAIESKSGAVAQIVGLAVFGLTLFLLYTASAVYHMLNVSDRASNILRRIDHIMIFVLIAGTYTPVCLVTLRGAWGTTLLVLIWLIALAGVLLKVFWFNMPRWLSSAIYVVMGWLAVIAFYPLVQTIHWDGALLLVAGGLTYTLGAVIYALKWPRLAGPVFGFHELFHLFVMGGTVLNIVFMFKYVL